MVVARERRRRRVLARQETGGQRHAREDSDLRCGGRRQDLIKRLQTERVEDDLHVRDPGTRDGRERLLARLDRHTVRLDEAVLDQAVERIEQLVCGDDVGGWAVELHQVQGVDAEVLARPLGPAAESLFRVVLAQLVDASPHLRRDGDAVIGSRCEELSDERLRATVTVDIGGVEEGHPGVGGCREHGKRSILVDRPPIGSELPRAEADR